MVADNQAEELPKNQPKEQKKQKQPEKEMPEEFWYEKETNQGIMLSFLGEDKAKKMFDDLPDSYICEFVTAPIEETYSDYMCITNYKKKMRIAYIGVPTDTEKAEVIIRPILRNTNELKFEEKLVVIVMLNKISEDLGIPVDRKIKI